MKKRSLIDSFLMYSSIAVIQILWIPFALLGFVCTGISKLSEILHIELCEVVFLIKNKYE